MPGRGLENIVTNDLLDDPLLSVFSLMQDVARCSQEKSKKLKAVESGLRELQAKDRHIEEEIRKNIDLRKELDKLKQERT
jgi:hypothetical protein